MSTSVMVLQRTVSSNVLHPMRIAGMVGAYALALVTGTAILIAAIGSLGSTESASVAPSQFTAVELVMQQTAERGVQSSGAVLLAVSNKSNDKRGF